MTSSRTDVERLSRLEQIRDIAAEIFRADPREVEAARSFETDLDTDSLLAVDLLIRLEEHFDVCIETAEIPRLMTDLQTAYQLLAEKAGWPPAPRNQGA